MGALPRPDVPPGGQRDLIDALHDLHHHAGWPSLRALAREAGCSHTTVSAVFSSPRLPSWGTLELLVEALHGDTDHFHDLWLAASTPDGQRPASVARIAGRRDELAAVRHHLETGTGLLLVTGEAGIGKTALVTTAADAVRDHVLVPTGHCLPLSSEAPMLPLVEVLSAMHEHRDGSWLGEALADLPAYVPAALAALLPGLGAAVPGPVDGFARQRLFTAVKETLTALARLRPFGILVEDLHWADTSTLDLLEHLTAGHICFPILGTWRTDDPTIPEYRTEWLLRVRRLSSTAVVTLGVLDPEETAEQLRLLFGTMPDPTAAARIHARTHGQPLFTEQLAAHEGEDLPGPLAQLLDRRLLGLDGPARDAVRVLGVAGRALDEHLLAAAGGLAPDATASALRTLRERRLLSEPATHGFELRHPLLGEAVRRGLLPSEASETSRRLATALAERPDSNAAEVAAHWRAAQCPAEELAWQVRAASTASGRLAHREAADHWIRALSLLSADTTLVGDPAPTRSDVRTAALECLDLAGATEVAVGITERALAEDDLSPMERADLLRRSALYAGRFDNAADIALLDEATAIYRALPVSDGLVHTLDLKATALEWHGRLDEAALVLAEAEAALALLPGSPLRRGLEARLGWLEIVTGHPEKGLQHLASATGRRPDGPEPQRDVFVGVMHSDALLMLCRPPGEVAEAARPGLESARTWHVLIGMRHTLVINVSAGWRRAGRPATALDVVTEEAQLLPEHLTGPLDLERAALAMLDGRCDEARELVLQRAEDPDCRPLSFHFQDCLAVIELWLQQPDRALRRLLAMAGDEPSKGPGELGCFACHLARAAADLAARERTSLEGRRILERDVRAAVSRLALDPFAENAVPSDRVARATWEAELARLGLSETVEHWVVAAAAWQAAGRPHDAAYCRWRAAQVAMDTRQAALATKLLRRATREAREHVPLLRAIEKTAAGARRALD